MSFKWDFKLCAGIWLSFIGKSVLYGIDVDKEEAWMSLEDVATKSGKGELLMFGVLSKADARAAKVYW